MNNVTGIFKSFLWFSDSSELTTDKQSIQLACLLYTSIINEEAFPFIDNTERSFFPGDPNRSKVFSELGSTPDASM